VITVAAFALAAVAGALTRAEVGHRLNRDHPLGTLTVNVFGAFALGLLAGASNPVLTVVGVGGLGTLTTFSSFARDAVALVEEGRVRAALAYVAATVGLGLAAAGAGLALGAA
jgi:CrcB protein